jgi:hypothetical protein
MAKCYARNMQQYLLLINQYNKFEINALCIFITWKLHAIKFIVDRLSLFSMLFIPCVLDEHIHFHKQIHNIVNVRNYCDMFLHEYATFRWCVCQLWTV